MRRRSSQLVAIGLMAAICLSAGAGSAAAATPAPASLIAAPAPDVAPADTAETKLFVRYLVQSPCTVHPNYPKPGVVGDDDHTWTIAPDGRRSIIWRYNVNSEWAVISDPGRAQAQFPWWGFTRRDCLGTSVDQADYPAGQPVPSRVLEGRSGQTASGWRGIDFSVAPAPITGRQRLDSTATLRDPANFVIGNVFPGWTVEVTDRTRSNGHWVEVHVPNADRWGYVEAVNLH